MTEDYLLLFCRYPCKKGGDIIHIELFCATTFLYKRYLLGCSQDCISQVSVNQAGTHAVALCIPPCTGITELVTWNLETEDHKHITRFPAVLTKALCFDLRFCLGICSGQKYLLLWDLTSSITDQTLTYNIHKLRSDGTEDVFPLGKTSRYAVCRSIRTGTVCVWNLARQRFVCRPVQVEHSLYSSTDVVFVHDLKLYILTDRNTNSFNQLQTLLVYDLLKRSYVRRQTGMAISSCLQHEYHLLEDGETLLGLSETRDHLVLWDLNSGSIKHELKPPSHREKRSVVQDQQPHPAPHRRTTLMRWDVRTESLSAKKRRLEREAEREKEEKMRLDREKFNVTDQYLLSGDEQVVVCSYFAHHLNVFSVASREHLHTLEEKTSLLSLQPADLTHTGSHLVLTAYDEEQRSTDVTLWDLLRGTVEQRLRNEPGVSCIAVTDGAERIVFGVSGGKRLMVWEPFRGNCKSISGYGTLRIDMTSKLFVTDGGSKAFLLAGQVSLWDLEKCSVLSVLSLDADVSCVKLLPGRQSSLVLGLSHSPALIAVSSTPTASSGSHISGGEDLFGESSSSEDEEL